MAQPFEVNGIVWLSCGERNFGGAGRIGLLKAIRTEGSITRAARRVGLSYKAAWDAVDTMNNLAGQPLVARTTGGRGGGSTRLTERGERLIANFDLIQAEHRRFLDLLSLHSRGLPDEVQLLRRLNLMKTSARNQFAGKVASFIRGSVNDEVELEIAGGHRIVAIVTHESAENLGLKEGAEAFALIKASSVIVMVREEGTTREPRLSARNRLTGTVSRLQEGAVNSEVVIDLPGGGAVAAIITNESARGLGLAPGKTASAIFKASSVIVGTSD